MGGEYGDHYVDCVRQVRSERQVEEGVLGSGLPSDEETGHGQVPDCDGDFTVSVRRIAKGMEAEPRRMALEENESCDANRSKSLDCAVAQLVEEKAGRDVGAGPSIPKEQRIEQLDRGFDVEGKREQHGNGESDGSRGPQATAHCDATCGVANMQPTLWGSLLPHRQLRVLLVEDDDSTRHVVSALLRNCGYEVTAVATTLQAWDLIEEGRSQFDLVLSEVMIPGLSGVGLLAKIMNRQPCKRMPVIMMSSEDAIDVVLKCFQTGASDFLVKPVRKNELRNLWQHVWRRTYTSSGSGSGSVSGTCKAQAKSRVGSGNGEGSNNGSGSGSSGINAQRGSDNGSGTQNEATRRIGGDRREMGCGTGEEAAATSEDHAPTPMMGDDLAIGTSNQDEPAGVREPLDDGGAAPSTEAVAEPAMPMPEVESAPAELEGGEAATDYLGTIVANKAKEAAAAMQPLEVGGSGTGTEDNERDGSNSPDKGATPEPPPNRFPGLELSLKRPRVEDDTEQEDRKLLRQSGSSAFSRYSTPFGLVSNLPHQQQQQQQPGSMGNIGSPPGPGAYPLGSMPGYMQGMNMRMRGMMQQQQQQSQQQQQQQHQQHQQQQQQGERQDQGAAMAAAQQDMQPPSLPRHLHGRGKSVTQQDGGNAALAMQDAWPAGGAVHSDSHMARSSGMGSGICNNPMTMQMRPPGMMPFEGMGQGYPLHAYYHPSCGPWLSPEAVPPTLLSQPDREGGVYDPSGGPSSTSHMHHHNARQQHGTHMHHMGMNYVHHAHAQALHQQQQVHHRAAPHHPSPQAMLAAGTKGSPAGGHLAQAQQPQEGSLQRDASAVERERDAGASGSGGSNDRYGNGNSGGTENRSVVGSNNGSNGFLSNNNGHSNGGQSGLFGPIGGIAQASNMNVGDSGPRGGCSNGQSAGTEALGEGISAAQNMNGGVMVLGAAQNRAERREEALNKFRQKRKERCFEKKVRYQSRKRLAEQRPRVRGQFVRQAAFNS